MVINFVVMSLCIMYDFLVCLIFLICIYKVSLESLKEYFNMATLYIVARFYNNFKILGSRT